MAYTGVVQAAFVLLWQYSFLSSAAISSATKWQQRRILLEKTETSPLTMSLPSLILRVLGMLMALTGPSLFVCLFVFLSYISIYVPRKLENVHKLNSFTCLQL